MGGGGDDSGLITTSSEPSPAVLCWARAGARWFVHVSVHRSVGGDEGVCSFFSGGRFLNISWSGEAVFPVKRHLFSETVFQ